MKTLIKVLLIVLTISLISVDYAVSATKTWSGNTSTDWNNSGNWVGGIVADSSDNIVINSNAPNNLILSQNQKVTNFTINGDTLDLGGYTFEITGTAYFNGGLVKNGLLKPTGSLCHFGGATLDARIEATCGYFHMNSGVYKKPVFLTSTGAATTSSTSGNHFEDSLTITNNGAVYFNMGSSGEDIYDGPVILYNYSSKEIRLASTDTSYFNNSIYVNDSLGGGMEFGASGGVSILASGKTISVGTFSSNYLTLTKFIQLGNTAQSLTLSGTGVVSLEGCIFNGNLTINAPGILTKTSTYYGNTIFNRTGSITNFHSYGSNVYVGNVTWDNAGNVGRIRLASTAADTYLGDATFSSSGGQDLQVAYVGDNTFSGNITINSNKVVFNTSTGKVTFTGTGNQTLNGSYNYPFKKLAINKTSGAVTANTTLSVDDSLIFIQGNLITTSTNLLTMKHGSIAHGASNSSFVSGPVKKIGNTAFVFDVGSGTTYRPLTITAPSNTSDAFTAEYYSAGQTLGTTKDTTITFVSDCGYWKLDRNIGSSNITPKFAFDSLHCDYLTVKPVHIALWNGTKWTDKGEAVTESTNKTTSSAMTGYGYFAFAYDLKPGDAPQMPYEYVTSSSCQNEQLLFDTPSKWISFKPDSAVLRITFFNVYDSLIYAPIKSLAILSAYLPGDSLTLLQSWVENCDSSLGDRKQYITSKDTSNLLLLKIDRFLEGSCDGIYDSIPYYLDFCIENVRMQSGTVLCPYSGATELFNCIGNGTPGNTGTAISGDIVYFNGTNPVIDLDAFNSPVVNTPFVVSEGIRLTGNYDMFSETAQMELLPSTVPPSYQQISTNPEGTIFRSSQRGPMTGHVLQNPGYVFRMFPGASIQNIRLEGAMPGFQDYNFDTQLCAGIQMDFSSATILNRATVKNCEIFNFSYAGIFAKFGNEHVIVDNNYIHHINGSGGVTEPKGYGVWVQGPTNLNMMTNAFISRSIFEDSKEGVDSRGNPINMNISDCTFGKFLSNEAIVKHNTQTIPFEYPDIVNYFYTTTSTPCNHVTPNSNNKIEIEDLAIGEFKLNKSIFHQTGKNITLPFPFHGSLSPTPQLYNMEFTNSVFTEPDALPGDFDCNYGGYVRIADNQINAPFWTWAKTHDVNSTAISTSMLPPIILNTPNSFSYQPGISTNSGTCLDCPQPPEVKIGISPIHGYVSGDLSNEPIPYVNQGSNITITTRQDNVGQPNVAFIVRPKTNNGLASGENNSSGNAFNSSEIVTSPCTGSAIPCTTSTTYTSTPSPSNPYWNTNMPGLYGIDAYAVDKNNRHQSKMAHYPFIIAPGPLETHRLIFNIKDSYYADLYGTAGTPTEIYKQVELNGHMIWQEDIASGGDDWEYVIIDLFDPAIAPFLDTRNFKNTITFSIAIANKCSTSSIDHRGLRVWVDDVYLQGKDGVENLMKDGSIENSTASGLSTSPTNESVWYTINRSKFTSCFSVDSKYPTLANLPTAERAGTEANIAFNERRSGSKSIEIKLDGIHDIDLGTTSCNTYCDLSVVGGSASSPLYPDVYISVAFDFDFRDFIDCNTLTSSLLENPYEEFPASPLDPDYTDRNFIVTSNITISSDLQLKGCQLAIEPHDPPYTITIPNNITLELLASAINSTKLFACSEMWGGIIVQNGGILNIEGVNARRTEIHDALTGVYNNGGISKARYAVFDHNYIGMHFENGSHFNQLPTASEGISATEFRCSGGEINLPPFAGEPSNTHILLEDVDEIRIGGINITTSTGTISFSDAVYGIHSINSNFDLYNSEFERMQNFSDVHPCFTCGAGIYAENTTSGSFEMKIGTKNGLNSTFLKNTFKNSKIGIFTKGNFVLDCDDNSFEDLVTGIRSNRNNSIITIHDNNFERVNNGVIVFNSRGNMKVNDNTFVTSAGLPPGVNFNNTAITIQNPISRFINQEVSVFGNTITDYRIGIHAINIPTPGIGFDIGTNTIAGNEIIYNINNFPLTEYHGGIWLQNCPQARIFDNTISNTDFNADDNFRGIDIWSSVLTDVNCNDITNLGVGISFFDDCRNSQLRSNVITEFNRGVWLNGISGQGMINLVQGVQGTLNSAWDNIWKFNDPANNTGQFKVDGLVIGNQPINWYHKDADNSGNDWSPRPWNGSMVFPIEQQSTAGPNCFDILRWAGDSRIANFGPVVGDTAAYGEYSDQLRYLARNTTFLIMKTDTSILNIGDSLDVYFESFYNQLDTSNTGLFHKIQSLLETVPDSAYLLIEAMVPENELEEKLLAFYQIYFDALYADDNLSSTDSAVVMEWAQGNVALSGNTHFYSLATMFEEKHPEMISLRTSGSPSNSVENTVVYSNDNIEVFPNPADQSLTVKMVNSVTLINKIEVISSLGKIVATYAPDNSNYLLNLKGITPGLYFLKVYSLDKEYNKKIQILR